MSPEAESIIAGLKKGNERYVNGRMESHDFVKEIRLSSAAPTPRAMVLTCMDSRVAPELIFDTHLGELFDARIAGNVVSDDIISSMKLACLVATARVIVVMGHTGCKAIGSAIDEIRLGSFTGLLDKLRPAINAVSKDISPRTSDNPEFVNAVARENVHINLQRIRDLSPLLREKEEQGDLALVGCLYHVESGIAELPLDE